MFDQQVTFLYCTDLEASTHFYQDLLELPLVLDQGACRIFRAAPGSFLGVCAAREDRPVETTGVITTFVSQDVDGWYEKLKAKGVAFEKTPQEFAKYNIYHCFLRDPDGYLLEIQRFNDPVWPRG